MKREIFKYLRNHCSSEPESVDRLIVSSFLRYNNIEVTQNIFIKDLIITQTKKEEYDSFDQFYQLLLIKIDSFDFETLIEFFEFVVSPADKVITGAIYTPKRIREYIIEEVLVLNLKDENSFKAADIACGCGSFLFDISKKIKEETKLSYYEIFRDNIYGLDIQEYSIVRSKILLSLLAVVSGEDIPDFAFNFFVGDALDFFWTDHLSDFNGFDVIVGNPPYVCSRNIPEQTKQYLSKWEVCLSGHPDLYIPFFQIGIENLKPSGILGYTMNSFFKSVNGRALRSYFYNQSFKFKIIDFGNYQVFGSKSTYTCICFLEKTLSNTIEYGKVDNGKLNQQITFEKIKYSSLDYVKGWNLQKQDFIQKIESTGIPFGELYKTRNGIATLKNHVYIFNPVGENEDYYFLQNEKVYEIGKSICRDIINPNKLIELDAVESLKQKIIFPYHFEGKQAKLYDEPTMNIFFPKVLQYLTVKKDILSTRDKANGNYENWYAFGRNQSLEKMKYKLFFPHITPKIPNYVLSTDENLLFHNGLAVISDEITDLLFLQKLMSSKIFWYYIEKTSKPYGSGYYSLSRNYIKNFGICPMKEKEKDYIINENDMDIINDFFCEKYGILIN